MPIVSVIVPVYNAEKYLHRCINSILAQTFVNFELLLINDGSSDTSGVICDQYAACDSRIRVFHKTNGGVASARNWGIKKAKGVYSIHVDSDDYIDKNMLYDMVSEIEFQRGDILIANYYIHHDHGDKLIRQYCENTSNSDLIRKIFYHQLLGVLWNKLIRHELYKKYKIDIIENIDYCEDVIAVIRLLLKTNNIIFIDKGYYHYDITDNNSITRNFNRNTFENIKRMLTYIDTILPNDCTVDFHSFILEFKGIALRNNVMKAEEVKGFFRFSNTEIIRSIMRRKVNRRMKINVLLANLFGFKLSKPLIKLINR